MDDSLLVGVLGGQQVAQQVVAGPGLALGAAARSGTRRASPQAATAMSLSIPCSGSRWNDWSMTRRISARSAARDAEQGGDDLAGHHPAVVGDQVEPAAGPLGVEQVRAQPPDAVLQHGHPAGGEGPRHQAAQLGVVGRVGEDHEVAALDLVGHELEDRPVGRAEQVGLAQRGIDVVEPAQRPEVEAVVAIDGRLGRSRAPPAVGVGLQGLVVGVPVRASGSRPRSDGAAQPRVAAAPEALVKGVVVDGPALPGQLVDELDDAGLLVRGDVGPAVLDQLVGARLLAVVERPPRPAPAGSSVGSGTPMIAASFTAGCWVRQPSTSAG